MADESVPQLFLVLDQQPGTRVQNGRFEDGMEVRFRTVSGVEDVLFIPNDIYSADNVRAMVRARAIAIETVQGLSE